MDDGVIEAFNGRQEAEWLNENWFTSIKDAQRKVEVWRREQHE